MELIKKEVCPTSACFPGMHYHESIKLLQTGRFKDNCIGELSLKHMQLCPQNKGFIDEKFIDFLKTKYPKTTFRLHANVKLYNDLFIFDACSDYFDYEVKKYRKRLKQINKHLNANIYTYHAGGNHISFKNMKQNIKRLQDYLDIPVAIEGLYPEKHLTEPRTLMTTFKEYEQLLNEKLYYVIDLSHLNIILTKEKKIDLSIVKELLESDRCLEIHISGNNGTADSHRIIKQDFWWLPILNDIQLNNNTTIFTEGDFRKRL